MAVPPLVSLSLVQMRGDRQSRREKVKQSGLHVNCLMSQQSGTLEKAHTSAQMIVAVAKHTVRHADGCDLNLTSY